QIEKGFIAIGGTFIKEKLTGYDSNAKTDLKAREIILDSNKTLIIF
ncbi:MAG: hypothetical protein GYA14_14030, partial [Ignavibacteria bacterium]|nr:hypothetical protein [Ignavibacteria bacterium]